ncbi:MAG: phage tail tube protein [Paraclostridium sp.]
MNAKVLIGVQAAKGTRATKFIQLFATDYGISPESTITKSEALSGSRFFMGKSFLSRMNVGGDIPVEFTPDTLLWLIEHAGFKQKTPAVAGDISLIAAEKCDKWLTIVGDYTGEGAHEIVIDCKINSINIEIATESFVKGSINVIGCNMTFDDTKAFDGTVTAPTTEQLVCLDSTFSVAGTDISTTLTSASLSLNNNLEGVASINSVYNTDIRESNAEGTVEITYNRFDKAVYKKGLENILAAKEGVLVMKLGTDAADKYIEITIHKATITDNKVTDMAGFGGMTQSYTLGYDMTEQTPMTVLGKGYGEAAVLKATK